MPLPPTPPKMVNPFSLSGDENEFGTSGGIVMQMPTGQFVVMPLTPTTGIDLNYFIMNCKYWIENSLRQFKSKYNSLHNHL